MERQGWEELQEAIVALVNKVLGGKTGYVGGVRGFRFYGVDRSDLVRVRQRGTLAEGFPVRPWVLVYGTLPRVADLEHGDVLSLLPSRALAEMVDYLELGGGVAHELLKGGAVVVKDRQGRNLPYFLDKGTEQNQAVYPWKGCAGCDFPEGNHRFGCSVYGREQLVLPATRST